MKPVSYRCMKKTLSKRNIVTLGMTLLLTVPTMALGAVESAKDIIGVINKLGGWLYSALVALAVVFIIIGAFGFLTAGGDESKVSKAKQQILYAVIAVVTALLATGIIEITKELLGAE